MNSESSSAKSIFLQAVELYGPEQWTAYLDGACGKDKELRSAVDRLLSAHQMLGEFQDDCDSSLANTLISREAGTDLNQQIGPYKIREKLAEGGMGIVYVAEQTEPIRRKVALKVIKPGMDTREVISRFEAERQALAMMSHPNIAKVLDGATTEQGRPYFVMELVKGLPITELCDQQELDTRQRLELFITVCKGVQHAHMKGIIHRDLKPSNVLVELHDVEAVPKIIDFGIAKAMNQQLSEHTIYTQFSQLVGTPLYMSPEQAQLSGLDIDTRSDVYSLGVMLYELLTGTTPFDKQTLRNADVTELRRIICEDDPPRPSLRVSTLKGQVVSTISEKRKTDQSKLSLSLQRELDWIVMKALEKDRNRRYESASALAADLQRYLDDEPVQACPPSIGYRLRKSARKYRLALTTSIIVLTALVTGLSAAIWQAAEAKNARNLAEEQRLVALNNWQKALDAVDQMLTRVGDLPLSDVPHLEPVQQALLSDALEFYRRFNEVDSQDPTVRYRMAIALYRTSFMHSFERQKAARTEAMRLLQELQFQYPRASRYRFQLAVVQISSGWYGDSEGEACSRDAIELLEPMVTSPPDDLQLEDVLATNRPHRCAALPLDLERIDPHVAVEYVLRCQLGDAYRTSARYYIEQNELGHADDLLRKAIQVSDRAHGWNENLQAWCYNELSIAYAKQGLYDASIEAMQTALQKRKSLLQDHPEVVPYRIWLMMENLQFGYRLRDQGRVEQAAAAFRNAWNESRRLNTDYPLYADSNKDREAEARNQLAQCLHESGLTAELEEVIREPLDRSRHSAGAWLATADGYDAIGDREHALEAYRTALQIDPKCLEVSTSPYTLKQIAAVYFALGQYGDSLRSLTGAVEREPADLSIITRIKPEEILSCPDPQFRQGMLALADRAVQLNERSTDSLTTRAALLAGLGEWERARDDLDTVNSAKDTTHYPLYQSALLALAVGDQQGCRAVCQRMCAQFNDSEDPLQVYFAAWTCALAPKAIDDYEPAVKLARNAVEQDGESKQYLTGLGALLMRAGQYEAANEQLEKALASGESEKTSTSYIHYLLAMTKHHLGNMEAAHGHLATANESAEKELADSPSWNRKLTLELFRKEAEALINSGRENNQQQGPLCGP